jgi:hypothetical protein
MTSLLAGLSQNYQQMLLSKQEADKANKFDNLPMILEFYPQLTIDFLVLAYLAFRQYNVRKTGHSFNKSFPYSIKVKMLFLGIWTFITFSSSILMLFSTEHHSLWIK